MNNRITEKQARSSLREANSKRQYGDGAVSRFKTKAGILIDMFANLVEDTMVQEPNTGHGCRVQKHHVEVIFTRIENHMKDLLIEVAVEKALNRRPLTEEEE
tara:strand:+ start:1065 stop:1370 length:306 start_codon:yes stop_codon:yes gene_type:complete